MPITALEMRNHAPPLLAKSKKVFCFIMISTPPNPTGHWRATRPIWISILSDVQLKNARKSPSAPWPPTVMTNLPNHFGKGINRPTWTSPWESQAQSLQYHRKNTGPPTIVHRKVIWRSRNGSPVINWDQNMPGQTDVMITIKSPLPIRWPAGNSLTPQIGRET